MFSAIESPTYFKGERQSELTMIRVGLRKVWFVLRGSISVRFCDLHKYVKATNPNEINLKLFIYVLCSQLTCACALVVVIGSGVLWRSRWSMKLPIQV